MSTRTDNTPVPADMNMDGSGGRQIQRGIRHHGSLPGDELVSTCRAGCRMESSGGCTWHPGGKEEKIK